MSVHAVAFIFAMGLTLATLPLVIRFARSANLFDRPGLRKTHREMVPRLGGVAVAIASVLSLVFLAGAGSSVTWSLRDNWPQWTAFVVGAVMVFVLGLVDDLRGVRASRKLLVQIAAAGLVCALGIRLDHLRLDNQLSISFGVFAWPITILWIVGMTNAMNLIDGLDGLAAGISLIASAVIAVLALTGDQPALGLVMIVVAGSLAAFLLFNFHPARIFLGDCGAMSLGFLLATASVRSAAVTCRPIDIALPALAMILPILDTLHCILRRRIERRSVFSPDRGHIHHRLMDLGFSQKGVALVLYAITGMACGVGLLMLVSRGLGTIVVFLCVFLLVIQLLKAIGAMPLREHVVAMHRSRAIVQRAVRDRQAFEKSRLRFEGVGCFAEWWTALCAAAKDMGAGRIAIWMTEPSGESTCRQWHADKPTSGDRLRTTLLLRTSDEAPPAMLEIDVPVEGAYESAGCRVQFFARLIDENNPATLAGSGGLSGSAEAGPSAERIRLEGHGEYPEDRTVRERECVLSGVMGAD